MANRADILNRLAIIEEKIIDAWTTSEIERSVKATWGLSRRQTERYIAAIYKRWGKQDETRSKGNLARAIRTRQHIAKKAREKGDLKTALAAEDSLAKLQGLMTDQVRHSGSIEIRTWADLLRETGEIESGANRILEEAGRN